MTNIPSRSTVEPGDEGYPGNLDPELAVDFLAKPFSRDDLLKKVRETPDWKEYMEKGAFTQTAMAGEEFTKWLGTAENVHRELMKEAGFIAK